MRNVYAMFYHSVGLPILSLGIPVPLFRDSVSSTLLFEILANSL